MTYSDKIYRKLFQNGDFADQIAYGIYAANVVKYIKDVQSRHQYVSDDMMDAFYTAEEAHIQDYQEIAKGEIQEFSNGITEANADKLLEKVAEKVNGKHPHLANFVLNILAALVWNVLMVVIGIVAVCQSDTFAKACIDFFQSLASK